MHLVDHTEPVWNARMRAFGIGGAKTYSIDLVNYQIPHWREVLGEDDLVATCPLLGNTRTTGHYNNVIQYLHTYRYSRPVHQLMNNIAKYRFTYNKLIFITAYKAFRNELLQAGLNAVYIPMSIDVPYVEQFKQPKAGHDKFIYFGNVVGQKTAPYLQLQKHMRNKSRALDVLSFCKLNYGPDLEREEVLRTVSTYKYGFGVGRCAQEMMTLGVKPVVYGAKFGGIMTNKEEYEKQISTNINGRIVTYSGTFAECLVHIDKSYLAVEDITKMNHPELVLNDYTL